MARLPDWRTQIQTRDQSAPPLTNELSQECDLQEDSQVVGSLPSVSSPLHDREAWQETTVQEQEGIGQSIDGDYSECPNLISRLIQW